MSAQTAVGKNPLEAWLAFSDTNRGLMYIIAAASTAAVTYLDYKAANASLGFLYVLPVLLASVSLRGWQIIALAVLCAILREWLGDMHAQQGEALRVAIGASGFALAGFFVSQLSRQRKSIERHLSEREHQMLLREEAELQLCVLIDTSPLGILTVDGDGRVLLANGSARRLFLASEQDALTGEDIVLYVPIFGHVLRMPNASTGFRTTAECKARRANGEVFLAHVWLSTFSSRGGARLAAFIWDASESLRDREGTGLDSMMATSRVLIGAMSHEIRNLAAAASAALRDIAPDRAIDGDRIRALEAVVAALETVASSGLRLATRGSKSVADLGVVLDQIRVLIDAAYREMGCEVHWNVPEELPLVQADHQSLLQVFLNLARNAQHALRHAAHRALSVRATIESDMVIVRFRDTGSGVANPERLFLPFQKGAVSTGLGLYISRAVLRSHGADLRYEGREEGSCFVVQLRQARTSEPLSVE
ncbi:MAG TPA: ATP-binding protein [Steroidobacteraceae bacterium]|nr:ATP-binding protein [Steroidobacteraceae bacterium]